MASRRPRIRVRLRRLALVAGALPLFVAAACGQTGGALGPTVSVSISPPASLAAPSPTPMAADVLQSALLTPPEVGEGWQYAGTRFLANAALPIPATDDAECAAIGQLLMNEATQSASAQATATFAETSGSGAYLAEVLRSYDMGLEGGPVDELDAMLGDCDAFTVAGVDVTVSELTDLPDVGDASAGARLEVAGGQSVDIAVAQTGYQVVLVGAFLPQAGDSLIGDVLIGAVAKVESL